MISFKKALFGGYKKSSVEAAVNELNRRIESAEDDKNIFRREIEYDKEKIAGLEKILSELNSENDKLREERAEFENIFADLSAVHSRIFGSEREEVCTSRESARKLLEDITARFDTLSAKSTQIAGQYGSLLDNIGRILSVLNNDISSVLQNAGRSFEGYGASKESGTPDGFTQAADAKSSDMKAFVADAKLTSDVPAHAPVGTPVVTPVENPVDTAVDTAAVAPADNATDAAVTGSEADSDIVKAGDIENANVILSFDPAFSSRIEGTAQNASSDKASEDPSKDKEEASADDFTQFGRKSKLSPQERSEFLRKALLKNNGI